MPAFLTHLPKDILAQMSEYLSVKELCALNATAKFFQPVAKAALLTKLQSQQVSQIVAGDYFTLFLQQDGTVWGCGDNTSGQLGIGNVANQTAPVQVPVKAVQQ